VLPSAGIRGVSDGISGVSDCISGVSDGISGVSDGIHGVSDGIHALPSCFYNDVKEDEPVKWRCSFAPVTSLLGLFRSQNSGNCSNAFENAKTVKLGSDPNGDCSFLCNSGHSGYRCIGMETSHRDFR
jgi:hypothetical protein